MTFRTVVPAAALAAAVAVTGTAQASSSFPFTRPEAKAAMVAFLGGTGWRPAVAGGVAVKVKKQVAAPHDCVKVRAAVPYVQCGLTWTTRLVVRRGRPDWVCHHVVRYSAQGVTVIAVDDPCRVPVSWPSVDD